MAQTHPRDATCVDAYRMTYEDSSLPCIGTQECMTESQAGHRIVRYVCWVHRIVAHIMSQDMEMSEGCLDVLQRGVVLARQKALQWVRTMPLILLVFYRM